MFLAPPQHKPKPKLRTYPAIRISQEHLDFWHTGLMPHINHVLRGFYRKYPESVEISLESIGESPSTTKPTILVICTSINKVRSILKKHLVYDKDTFGLKVCRGKVIRSRKQGVKRSMAREFGGDVKPENAEHQDKPFNGASIGAYVGERHLPPVSFGGLIMVDDKPYGMTVHHMLDAPEDDEDEESDTEAPILRSSAHSMDMPPELTHSDSSIYGSDEEFMYSLSDYGSDFSDEQSESEFDDDDYQDESDGELEPGDIKGIPQGCGEEYLITQPAIDDVDEEFYPSEETRDEDHLDSFGLGEVYASSGIRRRTEDGIVHEIDWALFEFNDDRCPDRNRILSGERFCRRKEGEYPVAVAPMMDLAGLEVHCMARTSGLQTGRILPAMVIVKIYGRQTPSTSYQAAGKLGVPGDSGAWLVENEHGRACAHVLAWSSKKKVAYICPMDTLLRDIKETLGARTISLPGGEDVFTSMKNSEKLPAPQQTTESATEPDIVVPDEDEISRLLGGFKLPPTLGQDGEGDSREYILDTEQGHEEQDSDMRNFIPIRLASKQPEIRLTEIVMGGIRQHSGDE